MRLPDTLPSPFWALWRLTRLTHTPPPGAGLPTTPTSLTESLLADLKNLQPQMNTEPHGFPPDVQPQISEPQNDESVYRPPTPGSSDVDKYP